MRYNMLLRTYYYCILSHSLLYAASGFRCAYLLGAVVVLLRFLPSWCSSRTITGVQPWEVGGRCSSSSLRLPETGVRATYGKHIKLIWQYDIIINKMYGSEHHSTVCLNMRIYLKCDTCNVMHTAYIYVYTMYSIHYNYSGGYSTFVRIVGRNMTLRALTSLLPTFSWKGQRVIHYSGVFNTYNGSLFPLVQSWIEHRDCLAQQEIN